MSGKTLLNGLLLSAGLSLSGLNQPVSAAPTKTPAGRPEQSQFCVALGEGDQSPVVDPPNCGCSGGNCQCKPK